MKIIRGIIFIVGILCMFLGWLITGPYLVITAIYNPLWTTSEAIADTIQNRPKFISRILARLLDYIILTLLFGVVGAIIEVIFPSIIISDGFFSFILLGYFLISLFFFRKTIGDKLFKLELGSYREDGRISFAQIFIRTFFAPIGVIQGIFSVRNSKKYLVHDRVSHTDIIKKVS